MIPFVMIKNTQINQRNTGIHQPEMRNMNPMYDNEY